MLATAAGKKLEARARTEFRRELAKAELGLIHAAVSGQCAYYDADKGEWKQTDTAPIDGPPPKDAPAPNYAALTDLPEFSELGDLGRHLRRWGSDRDVHAELIRWLCISPVAHRLVDPLGLRLRGARIVESLNLEAVEVPYPLELRCCRLLKNANLTLCSIPELSLAGSWTKQIVANELKAGGSVNFGYGFHADGEIDLVSAKIDGTLDFSDATIESCGAYAVAADNIKATKVILGAHWGDKPKGFRSKGALWFPGAKIEGDFGGNGAEYIASTDPNRKEALGLQGAAIGGTLTLGNIRDTQTDQQRLKDKFTPPRFRIQGLVDLRGAKCQKYEDSNWNAETKLDGFIYDTTATEWTAPTRITWLKSDKTGATQPYYQLASYFDGIGKTEDAREVRIALETILFPQDHNPLKYLKPWIGYGYRPEKAIYGVGLLWAVGSIVYWRSYRMRMMVPSDEVAAKSLRETGELPDHYTHFSPIIASLEYTFPLVKLGQADKWQPSQIPPPPFEGSILRRFTQLLELRRLLRWFVWVQILLGWLLATLFLAAVAGLVQHGR